MTRRLTFRTLKIYLFELLIIFFGITLSFLFEQWRQHNNDQKEIANHLNLILLDIDDLIMSDRAANKKDSVEVIYFGQVMNKSIKKTDLDNLINTLDNYVEYSTTSFSIIQLSKSDLFEKFKEDQRIVAYVKLITELIDRQNEIRLHSDKLLGQLLGLSKMNKHSYQFKLSDKDQSKIELNVLEDDYQTVLNDTEFQSILNSFRVVKLQHRLSRKKMVKMSVELKSFIEEYQKTQ